jgi:two-component system OmpR family response regulator
VPVESAEAPPTFIDGVEVLRWPGQAKEREALARAGIPRLLLVEPGVPPPGELGVDEDWVRLPSDPEYVAARADLLRRWISGLRRTEPRLADDGQLHRCGRSVSLSGTEERIVRLLLGRRGEMVPRAEIAMAGWGRAVTPQILNAAMSRLRKRLAGIGLVVRSARGRGYLLALL